MIVIFLLVAGGAAAVLLLASGRQSPLSAAPEPGDHWHYAYLVHHCGTDFDPILDQNAPVGIHTHADGVIHIHPTTSAGIGPNATLGTFFEASGAVLTDESYTPGPSELGAVPMSEADGCNGEPAVLQVAFWENAWTTEEPEIFTEDLADIHLATSSGGAITVALLPEGAEIPKPPAERLAVVETSNGGRN